MFFYDRNNDEIRKKYEALPENIKSGLKNNAAPIKTAEEFDELVRRVRSAETGRIF